LAEIASVLQNTSWVDVFGQWFGWLASTNTAELLPWKQDNYPTLHEETLLPLGLHGGFTAIDYDVPQIICRTNGTSKSTLVEAAGTIS
jgi:hypothetical protein